MGLPAEGGLYTDQMYLYNSWPESTGTRFVKRKDDEETGGLVCTDDLVDVSRDDLKAEIARVIGGFLADVDADPTSEARYLEIVDGCQMDTAFVRQSGEKYVKENWRWQIETMRRFSAAQRYFLTKTTWPVEGKVATDRLDYGFASYLLGADGRYALWWPTRYVDWETEKAVSAPLGNFVGDYGLVPGFTDTYVRTFENGLVYVNADTAKRTVTLPAGTYRDVRGGTIKGRLTLNGGSAKILIKAQ